MTKAVLKNEVSAPALNGYDGAVFNAKQDLVDALWRSELWDQLMRPEIRTVLEYNLDPNSFDKLQRLAIVAGLLSKKVEAWACGE
jgi:hypothetical protein